MQGASPNSEKKSVAAQPIASPIHLEHVIGPRDMFSLYPDLNKYEKGQVTSKDFRGKRRKQLEPVLSPKNVEQKRIKIYGPVWIQGLELFGVRFHPNNPQIAIQVG
jgi:hypothetical protein